MRIICLLLAIYWFVLFARVILTWFPPPRSGLLRGIVELIFDLTEPVLKLVRGLLPPVRMGGMGLDLSPIVVFIALGVLQAALGCTIGF
jgi:YggT family protein